MIGSTWERRQNAGAAWEKGHASAPAERSQKTPTKRSRKFFGLWPTPHDRLPKPSFCHAWPSDRLPKWPRVAGVRSTCRSSKPNRRRSNSNTRESRHNQDRELREQLPIVGQKEVERQLRQLVSAEVFVGVLVEPTYWAVDPAAEDPAAAFAVTTVGVAEYTV